jgi:hypothetical protein
MIAEERDYNGDMMMIISERAGMVMNAVNDHGKSEESDNYGWKGISKTSLVAPSMGNNGRTFSFQH